MHPCRVQPLEDLAQRWVCLSLPSSHQPPGPTSTSAVSHPSACLFYSNLPLSHRCCPGFRLGEGLDAGLMRAAEQRPSISLRGSWGSCDDGNCDMVTPVAGRGHHGSPTWKQWSRSPVGLPCHNSERGRNSFLVTAS